MGAARVAAGILVTRVLGYVRERVFAYYFGLTAPADAFTAAAKLYAPWSSPRTPQRQVLRLRR